MDTQISNTGTVGLTPEAPQAPFAFAPKGARIEILEGPGPIFVGISAVFGVVFVGDFVGIQIRFRPVITIVSATYRKTASDRQYFEKLSSARKRSHDQMRSQPCGVSWNGWRRRRRTSWHRWPLATWLKTISNRCMLPSARNWRK
jgi:hypothetical protein